MQRLSSLSAQRSVQRLSSLSGRKSADLGAIVELSVHSCMPSIAGPGKSLAELAAMIQAVGAARCTLASDLGSNDAHPKPVVGLHDHLERLWMQGASEQDLRVMVCDNPARLLGLDA